MNLGEETESIADKMASYPEKTIYSALIDTTSNPLYTTSSTTTRYILPISDFVRLRIYNLVNRKIEPLVNENQSARAHEIDWITEESPSGIYSYRLESTEKK